MRYKILLLIVTLTFSNITFAETSYRKSLNQFWKKELKEEGLTPLTYASTFHEPKTVFVLKNGVLDYFASGIDLLPESRVKTHKADISLPGSESSSNSKLELALQLKKVKDIADVEFKALKEAGLNWSIESTGAEIHFFSKRDARRTMGTVTKPILANYFQDKKVGERLFQIVKAIYVKDSKIQVSSSDAANGQFKVGLIKVLENLGFSISKDKKSAYSVGASNMYVAVGFRELTKSGLKSTSNPSLQAVPPVIMKLNEITLKSDI